jgi:hypothetical protein
MAMKMWKLRNFLYKKENEILHLKCGVRGEKGD